MQRKNIVMNGMCNGENIFNNGMNVTEIIKCNKIRLTGNELICVTGKNLK